MLYGKQSWRIACNTMYMSMFMPLDQKMLEYECSGERAPCRTQCHIPSQCISLFTGEQHTRAAGSESPNGTKLVGSVSDAPDEGRV